MKVTINGTPLEIFQGATVGDVLRKFSKELYTKVSKGKYSVQDHRAYELCLKGELAGGEKIVIKEV